MHKINYFSRAFFFFLLLLTSNLRKLKILKKIMSEDNSDQAAELRTSEVRSPSQVDISAITAGDGEDYQASPSSLTLASSPSPDHGKLDVVVADNNNEGSHGGSDNSDGPAKAECADDESMRCGDCKAGGDAGVREEVNDPVNDIDDDSSSSTSSSSSSSSCEEGSEIDEEDEEKTVFDMSSVKYAVDGFDFTFPIACSQGNLPIAALLWGMYQDKEVDPMTPDNEGNSPIHYAALADNCEVRFSRSLPRSAFVLADVFFCCIALISSCWLC